jgi:hypothetical protein
MSMKKFIMGFIVCLTLTTSVYAAGVIKNSYFNESLKLDINGNLSTVKFITVEIEGEQWGRNYVSVADFIKALNDNAGMNATVDFDPNTQTIIVDSVQENTVTSIKVEESTTVDEMYTPDGIKATYIDGEYYIHTLLPGQKWHDEHKESNSQVYYKLSPVTIKGEEYWNTAQLLKCTGVLIGDRYTAIPGEGEIILDNIPLYTILGTSYIKCNYYLENILPLVN